MASIINNISFKNFFNYYGEYADNTYELKDGVNIIVADNGAGKSKFFNAFLWLFNDQILDSDDKVPKNVKDVFVKIISDKAKNECSIQDQIECGIQIEYTHGSRYKYQIIKSFTATKLDKSISDDTSWMFNLNDVEINRSELVIHRYKPIFDEDEKRKIIDKLIMPAFRKYSFLQGEEVDEIIDFTQKSSIEEAVQNLTDIKQYERLVEITSDFKERAEKDLKKQNKASDDQAQRLEEAMESKDSTQLALNNELKKLKEYENTYELAEREKNELDKIYANAEKRKELDDEIKVVSKKVRDLENDYQEYLERINNRFFDGNSAWIAMGFNTMVSDFQSENNKFIATRYEKKTLMGLAENPNSSISILPSHSPDAVTLKNMIEDQHCYVCNRPARKGTPEHNHLLELQNRGSNEESKETSFVKNDLKDFFSSIQINAQPFYNRIDRVRDSITTTKEREKELFERLSKQKDKLKSLKNQRKDILVAGNDPDTNSATIISQYQGAIRRMETARIKIDDTIKPRIQRFKSEIANIEKEIEGFNESQDIPQGYKDNYSIAKDLAEATYNAKERVYDDMVNLLEEHANKHFQNLIKSNDLAGGILKFEKSPSGSIAFNYIDRDGNIVYGSSEGFQRMKKFSVVMAIISANRSEYNYPLLADAPISAFGTGFIEGFFESTSKVFPQSIILVKELYHRNDEQKINNLGKKLLAEENVKTMYVNEVPKDAQQIELVTSKIKLK